MKFFLPFLFIFTLVFADVSVDGVNFTNSELNMTINTLNYIDYRTLDNYINNYTLAKCIINWRYYNDGIKTLDDLNNVINYCDVYSKALFNIKQCSRKFVSDLIVSPINTTYPLTNFLYALTGILIGFTIFFAIILHFAR